MNSFNSKGHINEESISLYVDALMTKNIDLLPEQVIDHVENCTKCKKEIIEVVDIMKEAKEAANAPVKSKSIKKSISGIGKTVALILLVLGFSYIAYKLIDFNTEQQLYAQKEINNLNTQDQIVEMTYNAGELNVSEREGISADNKNQSPDQQNSQAASVKNPEDFRASYNLESLVETNFRSNSIKVIAPRTTQSYTIGQVISFNFVNSINETLFIKVLNNKERNIFTTDFTGNQYKLTKKLQPGLYYWKLETEDDLLYVGKFLVE